MAMAPERKSEKSQVRVKVTCGIDYAIEAGRNPLGRNPSSLPHCSAAHALTKCIHVRLRK